MKVLITGGAGFIGSAVIRYLIHNTPHSVVNLDKLTYAGNLDSVASVAHDPRYVFEQADITDRAAVTRIFHAHHPDGVMHLAAESHVDRSIDSPEAFIQTNIVGTYTLLETAREYYRELSATQQAIFRFHHVSTDEVFGSLGTSGCFSETTAYDPRSPYSASKAASDHLVRAWHHTYGLPVILTNCSNNYGPYHFPEKLIPLTILRALAGQSLPVYGAGTHIRDWLYVEDHARALLTVLEHGRVGESYNIGGRAERANIDVVQAICVLLDEFHPHAAPHAALITHVADRPGHDLRYAIDPTKIERELGWRAQESFATGLRKTVQWYLENRGWWERVVDGRYRGERLGTRV